MARNLAYGNVLLGLASLFCNPFFLLSARAIGNGIYVVRRLRFATAAPLARSRDAKLWRPLRCAVSSRGRPSSSRTLRNAAPT